MVDSPWQKKSRSRYRQHINCPKSDARNSLIIGIVEGRKIEHPSLIIEKRSRMKIMMLDVQQDIPVKTIEEILKMAIDIYQA